MLSLDLVELQRRGFLRLDASLPPGDLPLDGSGADFTGSVEVGVDASAGVSGQVILRGRIEALVLGACRRCLAELELPVRAEIVSVFVPEGDLLAVGEGDGGGDESLRTYPGGGRTLDLREAIREELILALPAWPVCRPDCRGLCPRCGADRNETACACSREEPDPRWAALRAHGPDE